MAWIENDNDGDLVHCTAAHTDYGQPSSLIEI